ncbi:MAG TPA: class I SAM-dependent methyltransferase [Nevskiaceae bacterium]|nr:class I SAM-dependent methyltransferase [Nevskiaceae bacterium]
MMQDEKLGEPLLLHSLGEFSSVTVAILDAVDAHRVAEIGSEHGGNTALLANWLRPSGGTLVSVDPAPSEAFLEWLHKHGEGVEHVSRPSLESIDDVGACDAWFIDGDHNWYTVFHELRLIHAVQRRARQPFLVILHDVGWPCARRDQYYAPERIPADCRQPYSYELGVTLGSARLIEGGFRGCGNFAYALNEGGARNGVLTAVEDFAAEFKQPFMWAYIPAIFGLGVLWGNDHPVSEKLATQLAPLHEHPLLARMEANRLANYLKVIELQDGAQVK